MAKHILADVEGFIQRGGEIFKADPRVIIIDPGWNSRKNFDGEEDLMNSIIENGVLDPLVVRKQDDKTLHLRRGERRLRAVLRAISEGHEIKAVPVCVISEKSGMTDAELAFDDYNTNQHGKPLEPLEEADHFNRFIKWGYTVLDIARKTGKSEQHVRNRIQLASATPSVRVAVQSGTVGVTEATEISKKSSIESQSEAVSKARRPHTKKNLIVRYDKGEVRYSGPEKTYCLEKLEAVLFNDDVWDEIKNSGFDPDSVKITFAPI